MIGSWYIQRNSKMKSFFVCLCTLFILSTGYALHVPRFVSLRTTPANFRLGPGHEYPTKWHYVRDRLPLKVLQEQDIWRFVEDHDGIKGWVHQKMLSGLRTLMVIGVDLVPLRQKPDSNAPIIAQAEPGAIGQFAQIKTVWCQVKFEKNLYWVLRQHIWGLLDDE